MEQRSGVEKKAIADYVDCYLLGKPPEGMEVIGSTVDTWRGNLMVQYLKRKSGPKTAPALLKRPQFPGPCTFPCHQSTSKDTWSLHYHWIMEECSEKEAIELRNKHAVVFQGPNNILLVREEEMKDVLNMMKTFCLFDFAPLWNERKLCRLKRLVYTGFMHSWHIDKALRSAGEHEQLEYLRQRRCSHIPLPPRNIYDIDPKTTIPVRKYGRIYYHQLVEKSMLDRRSLPNIDAKTKKGLALVNHRFFHCRGCVFDPVTIRRHYHYVVDIVYQVCKEFKSLRKDIPLALDELVPPRAVEAHAQRPRAVQTLSKGEYHLIHLTEEEVNSFKNLCLVRHGVPLEFPMLGLYLDSFFLGTTKNVWINQPDDIADQFENDTTIPMFTPLHRLIAPEEVEWQPEIALAEAFERLMRGAAEALAPVPPRAAQAGSVTASEVPAVAVVASVAAQSNGDAYISHENGVESSTENGVTTVEAINGTVERPTDNGTTEAVAENGTGVTPEENGSAGTSTAQENGDHQPQQAPSQLNGLPQIEEARQANDHAPTESNGLPQRGKRKASEDGPSTSDDTSSRNKRARPDPSVDNLWSQFEFLGPSTSRVCFPGHDRSQLTHSQSTSSDSSKF